MNTTQPNHPALAHESSAEPIRWDGHMSDGVGTTYGPEPMAFLSATPDELLLCGNRGSFRLKRTAIRKVSRSGFYPWFFKGVRIHHEVRAYPVELEFQAIGAKGREILERLKTLGYPVS